MIGVFDSGLGGLGVVLQIRRLMPDVDITYVGDRARAPYGDRSLDEVRTFSEQVTAYLVDRGADTIVLACNTASAAALHPLRSRHPSIAFVGMEPAVKPAAATSQTGVIGVLATAATFQSELFASVVDRFAVGRRVVCQACRGWVEMVESARLDGPEVEHAVETHLRPVLDEGVDTLVLGCTHYPFLRPVIARIAGPSISIVDPAEAVARQTARVASPNGSGRLDVSVTGDTTGAAALVTRLTGLEVPVQAVTLGP